MYFSDHSPSTEDVTEGLFAMRLLFAKKGIIIPITHGGGTPRLDFFKYLVMVASYMGYYRSMAVHRRLGENVNIFLGIMLIVLACKASEVQQSS